MKNLLFHADAYLQFIAWQEENPEIFDKVKSLLIDISRNPFQGLGKPEPLKHKFKGYWSRRITLEHRLIYKYEAGLITIVSLRGHYS